MYQIMPPTSPPAGAWSGWQPWQGWEAAGRAPRRRVRLSLAELAALRDLHHLNVDWTRLRPEITLYTPNQLRHLIRVDGSVSRGRQLVYPTVAAGWLRDPAAPWRLPDITHIKLEPGAQAPAPRGPTPAGAGAGAWAGAARGLPAGALLLALLVLLVRLAEKCLDKSFFKLSRRQSEEWPTPNVLATSLRLTSDTDPPHPEDSEFGEPPPADLPPPYSECSPPKPPEEPPPPYSACYVAYNNPKDGIPSVHFCNRNRQELFASEGHSSLVDDTGQGAGSSGDGGANVDVTASGTEFMFENGRIVERVVNDNDVNVTSETPPNTEEASNVHSDDVTEVNVTSSNRDRYLIV